MKKLVKFVSFILLVVISFSLVFNREIITAFAKNLIIDDVEYGQVYEYGDKIGIFDDWGDSVQNVWVGYLDKDDKLLSFLLKGTNIIVFGEINNGIKDRWDQYTYMNYFNLGYTCNETVEEFFDYKYVDDYLAEPEYYDSYLSLLNDLKRATCGDGAWFYNYLEYEDELKNISKWKVVNNEGKKMDYYCDFYDINSQECENEYALTYPVMMFQEYVEPKFEFVCDSDKVEYGKRLNCSLHIDSEEKITQLKTSINSKDLELDKILANTGWKYEVDKDGFYILKNENGFTGKENVVEFQFLAKKNIDSTTVINLDNFEYTTSGGYTEKVNLNLDVNIDASVNNPNTFAFNYLILFIVITCGVGLIFIIKPRKQYE